MIQESEAKVEEAIAEARARTIIEETAKIEAKLRATLTAQIRLELYD